MQWWRAHKRWMAHQFHPKLMGFVLGVGVRRKGKTTPTVWDELLLLQLGVQAMRECHLDVQIKV